MDALTTIAMIEHYLTESLEMSIVYTIVIQSVLREASNIPEGNITENVTVETQIMTSMEVVNHVVLVIQ